jgi:hypothetical protein
VLRRARSGALELRFARFPFLLGEPLEVELVRERGAPPLGQLTVTLSCLEERTEEVVVGDASTGSAVRQVVAWRESRLVSPPGGPRIPVRFDLPAPGGAVAGSVLTRHPHRRWELHLAAVRPGLDLDATFLVPVYQRPAADGAGV